MRKDAKITKVLVLIYSSFKSPRLVYTLNYLFNQRFGLDYTLLDNLESLDSEYKIHISYSHLQIRDAINILPDNLLNESEISTSVNGSLFLDPYNCPDPFAFIFFHLSRYEEYFKKSPDDHGRFKARDSVLYDKNTGNLLLFPIVDTLVHLFYDKLKNHLKINFELKENELGKIVPTIDIDSVFAYKGRSVIRHSAALLKDAFYLRWAEIAKRVASITGKQKDPNDNFDLQFEILKSKKAFYFIQCGPFGTYDKNISLDNKEFQDVLKKIKSKGHFIGLHPSYGSNSDPEKIKKEKEALEKACNIQIKDSRQHFLKMRLPDTYRSLIACGIERDWSMGYSNEFGFRAGTAFPFYWFDLQKNISTTLQIVPFCAMDVVFKQFYGSSPDECLQRTLPLRHHLLKDNLPFVFVFHNESLSAHRGWQGWESVFKKWVNG